jgi:hypothetical protein
MSSDGLRQWEGRQVSVALADGSRIDDCQLVSAGRCAAGTLWLFTNGVDLFVALDDVTAVWEAANSFRAA